MLSLIPIQLPQRALDGSFAMRQVRAITAPDMHVQQRYHYVRYFSLSITHKGMHRLCSTCYILCHKPFSFPPSKSFKRTTSTIIIISLLLNRLTRMHWAVSDGFHTNADIEYDCKGV